MDNKKREKIRRFVPKGYVWRTQWAKKRNKKGRAIGRIAMRIKKELIDKKKETEADEEEMMIGRVRRGEERWRIIGVYVNGT